MKIGRLWFPILLLLTTLTVVLLYKGRQEKDFFSPNQNSRIKYIILHYTSGDFEKSLNLFLNARTGVSAHYLIPERSDLKNSKEVVRPYKLVDESQRAWHAGASSWMGKTGINDTSIGIELVNCAESAQIGSKQIFNYPDYDPVQINALINLLSALLKKYPEVVPTHILGHSDIAPGRKSDPGPRFPWQLLYQHGYGAWFDYPQMLKYANLFNQTLPDISEVQLALKQYGYSIEVTGLQDAQTTDVIVAFQQHFVQESITGQPDQKTCAILFALLEKYHAAYTLKTFPWIFEETPIKEARQDTEESSQEDKKLPRAVNLPKGKPEVISFIARG